jgi:hypothetical protein
LLYQQLDGLQMLRRTLRPELLAERNHFSPMIGQTILHYRIVEKLGTDRIFQSVRNRQAVTDRTPRPAVRHARGLWWCVWSAGRVSSSTQQGSFNSLATVS